MPSHYGNASRALYQYCVGLSSVPFGQLAQTSTIDTGGMAVTAGRTIHTHCHPPSAPLPSLIPPSQRGCSFGCKFDFCLHQTCQNSSTNQSVFVAWEASPFVRTVNGTISENSIFTRAWPKSPTSRFTIRSAQQLRSRPMLLRQLCCS